LSAFIDDEAETVDALRSGGIQVHPFDQVSGLRVQELRATLTVGNRDPWAVKGTPRRRNGAVTQEARGAGLP
jgi:hypothetical protein